MAVSCKNYITVTSQTSNRSELKSFHELFLEITRDNEYGYTYSVDFNRVRDYFNLDKDRVFSSDYLDVDCEDRDGAIYIDGESDSGASLDLFQLISQKFPFLRIEYSYECQDNDFGGKAIFLDGKIYDSYMTNWLEHQSMDDYDFYLNEVYANRQDYLSELTLKDLMDTDEHKYLKKEDKRDFLRHYGYREPLNLKPNPFKK